MKIIRMNLMIQIAFIKSLLIILMVILLHAGFLPAQMTQNIYPQDGKSRTTVISSGNEIHLNNMNLYSVPSEVFELSELRVLDLSNNHLTELPARIKELKKLRVLDLRNNNIYELPFELSRLKFLKEIYLDYEYWYHNIDKIKNLTHARIILD